MQVRALSAVILAAALTACYPRQQVAPPPAPPPPVLVIRADPMESLERARRSFDEGVQLGRQSRWSEAADRYRLAAEADPNQPRYHLALAEALLQQGREWEAADALQNAIRVQESAARPNHRVIAVDYERLIQLLTRLNRTDEARTAQARQEQHRRMRDAAAPE